MKQVIKVNRVSSEMIQGLMDAGFIVIITSEKPKKAVVSKIKEDETTDLIQEFEQFLHNTKVA